MWEKMQSTQYHSTTWRLTLPSIFLILGSQSGNTQYRNHLQQSKSIQAHLMRDQLLSKNSSLEIQKCRLVHSHQISNLEQKKKNVFKTNKLRSLPLKLVKPYLSSQLILCTRHHMRLFLNQLLKTDSKSLTVEKNLLIQIWYLESRIQYFEFRIFLPIKYICKMCLEIIF